MGLTKRKLNSFGSGSRQHTGNVNSRPSQFFLQARLESSILDRSTTDAPKYLATKYGRVETLGQLIGLLLGDNFAAQSPEFISEKKI